MAAFLDLNGCALEVEEADVVRVMNAVAAGEMGEAEFAGWVRAHRWQRRRDVYATSLKNGRSRLRRDGVACLQPASGATCVVAPET
jgi:hypothetical protein